MTVAETVKFWEKHIQEVVAANAASENGLHWLIMHTTPSSFGDEPFQIRPDLEVSKWDIYFLLEGFVPNKAERILLAALTPEQVAQEERRERIRNSLGLDIDNPDDQAEYEFYLQMEALEKPDQDHFQKFLRAVLAEDKDGTKAAFEQASLPVKKLILSFQEKVRNTP